MGGRTNGRIDHPAFRSLDYEAEAIARSDHRDRARTNEIAGPAIVGRDFHRPFEHLHRSAVPCDGNRERGPLDHGGEILGLHAEMRIGLLADVEQRAAPVLDDLDDRALLAARRDPYLRIAADGHEFASAHQHRVPVRSGRHYGPGRHLHAAPGRDAGCTAADGHLALRFADDPRAALRQSTGATEQGRESG